MDVMIEKRKIELRIRGSHGPPNAEEQARITLEACYFEKSRPPHRANEERQQPAGGVSRSQIMAEVTITKHGPHV